MKNNKQINTLDVQNNGVLNHRSGSYTYL